MASNLSTRKHRPLAWGLGLALLTAAGSGAWASLPGDQGPAKLDRITGGMTAYVVGSTLETPDGLAIQPQSGDLYIAERDAGRISFLRDGKPQVAIDASWEVVDDLPQWAVTPDKPRRYWLHDRLRKPHALAFSADGRLYVTEDIADGRLLEFTPDENGHYRKARTIPIPWFYKNFTWSDIAITEDGRLFLAGSAAEAGPSLFFGVVLMRDVKGDWWVIDYGPFAGFSSVSLSRHEDILVVGEEVNGTLTWWDTLRHRAIGTVAKTLPNLQKAAPLPDGAIAVAVEDVTEISAEGEDTVRKGRIMRVDPQSGIVTVLAEGFGPIESLYVNNKTGDIYVTETQSGLVIKLQPAVPPAHEPYLLENTVRLAEIAQGLPPKKWPPYLKGFFRDLGVTPRDEVVRRGEQGQDVDGPNSYTLVEVGKAIPLIAGQVRTKSTAGVKEDDPITAIDFIVLFPNRSFGQGENASPGLAFFSARRASGKVERTHSLDGLKAIRFSSQSGWKTFSDKASVFLPTATCAVRPTDTGMDITLAFVSLHGGEDFYLQLHCGEQNSGTLVVDNKEGLHANYGIDFTEETLDGASYNSIVVAGMSGKDDDQTGWLNIGNWPMGYSLNPNEGATWTPFSANSSHPMLEALWGSQDADHAEKP